MPIQHIDLAGRASDYPEALSTYNDKTPEWRVLLYPHRSLPATGFVWVIAVLCCGLSVPLFGVFGTAAFWGVLPFLIITVAALWGFIMRSYRDGHIVEELTLWQDRLTLVHIDPKGTRKDWQANPYWVQVAEHKKPVKHYLTLKGGLREVELGAFLSAEERIALKHQLEDELKNLAA
ncbi:DUF2244 domain-containing protein [uncultured Litoreibacter sp.]|uniref:DUF2244 domain-containing protein n=1 Tax=uncultured Litoreibacter sp. TaxID=1392394 RepID=UPI00260E4785|nr:DUF2244 domain-containing protein [uncultured Litoreibacter sp.]